MKTKTKKRKQTKKKTDENHKIKALYNDKNERFKRITNIERGKCH